MKNIVELNQIEVFTVVGGMNKTVENYNYGGSIVGCFAGIRLAIYAANKFDPNGKYAVFQRATVVTVYGTALCIGGQIGGSWIGTFFGCMFNDCK